MTTFYPAGGTNYSLNASIGSTDPSIILTSFTEPVSGTPYTMAYFNSSIMFGTIAPRTTSSEFISFTGITQNMDGTATLTGVIRGLQKAYPYTSSATFKLPHSGQSVFILSDVPQVFNEYSVIQNAEIITGQKQFPPGGDAAAPTSGSSYSAPTNNLEYASKEYVDNVALSGAPNANTVTKGIVQEATVTQVNNGSPTGSTGAVLFPSPADLAASIYGLQLPTSGQKAALPGDNGSPGASNLYMTQSGFQNEAEVFGTTTGCSTTSSYALTLSPALGSYVDGQRFVFKASFASTGSPNTSTLNVNGLGAGNIIKNGSPGQTLIANDVITGQMIQVVRGSPNFQMVSPSANLTFLGLFANGITTKSGSGTQNIAHGLGVTPKFIKITVLQSPGTSGNGSVSFGTYNGTTVSCTFMSLNVGSSGTGAIPAGTSSSFIAQGTDNNQSNFITAVPTFNATNIVLTWSATGSPTGTAEIMWEAQA